MLRLRPCLLALLVTAGCRCSSGASDPVVTDLATADASGVAVAIDDSPTSGSGGLKSADVAKAAADVDWDELCETRLKQVIEGENVRMGEGNASDLFLGIAGELTDVVICEGLAGRRATPCAIFTKEQGIEECALLHQRFEYIASRPGREWAFTPADMAACLKTPIAKQCEAFRRAAQTGDAAVCPAGPFNGFCVALATLDDQACSRITGTKGKGATQACLGAVAERRSFAVGLAAMAEGKDARLAALAKAALHQPDACTPLHKALVARCKEKVDQPDAP